MALKPITYDVDRLAEDIALKGWMASDMARAADVSASTVSLFLNGKHQTAKTAAKLARALGYSVRRYLVTARRAA